MDYRTGLCKNNVQYVYGHFHRDLFLQHCLSRLRKLIGGEMNSTSLELSFKSHFVCLYMYVCNHVRTLIVQINMFKPIGLHYV